ncbi:MAG TPA: hypothetical protein VFC23_21850 [Thermoanaerobaculia bacterium]|nr:hypothetical protein [Thermoanaerobaculia bacterium]
MSARSENPPLFAAESPVVAMRAVFPLTVGEDGMAILPGEVRWALGLNPGDLLFTEWDEESRYQLTFRSYTERLRSTVDTFNVPWPWVKKVLERPMAAVAPGGGLMLPRAGAVLLGDQPGIRQMLRAWVERGQRWFTVNQADERQVPEEVFLEARYFLPVEPGFRVTLPADVLWGLSLADGDALVCETWLATAELKAKGRAGGRKVEVEPGGKLTVPEAIRLPRLSEPGARITLDATLSRAGAGLRLDLRDLS